MKRRLGWTMALLLAAMTLPASAQKIAGLDGDWNGALAAGGQTLHLVLHVESTAAATSAKVISVDQGNAEIPATLTRNGNTVTVDLSAVQASFQGTLAGNTLTGTFTQGAALPLTFTRQAAGK